METIEALAVADFCENEGVVSTAAMALRALARSYREVKAELDMIEFEQTKHIPQLLKRKE